MATTLKTLEKKREGDMGAPSTSPRRESAGSHEGDDEVTLFRHRFFLGEGEHGAAAGEGLNVPEDGDSGEWRRR
jgi:hypothetical protein